MIRQFFDDHNKNLRKIKIKSWQNNGGNLVRFLWELNEFMAGTLQDYAGNGKTMAELDEISNFSRLWQEFNKIS